MYFKLTICIRYITIETKRISWVYFSTREYSCEGRGANYYIGLKTKTKSREQFCL